MKKLCILKVMDLGYLKSGGVGRCMEVWRDNVREKDNLRSYHVRILGGGWWVDYVSILNFGHHDHVSVLNFGISLLVKICDVGLLVLMGLINAVKRDLGLWGSNWDQAWLVKLVHVDFPFWTQKLQLSKFPKILYHNLKRKHLHWHNSQATLVI